MKRTDILIIGGGPSGLVNAITARKKYPKKKITLVKEYKENPIPCGIPYIFSRLDSADKNVMSDKPLIEADIEIIINKATKLNQKEKKVILKNSQEIKYEKLILATGSEAIKIPIEGLDITNVWQIKKNCSYLRGMRQALIKAKNIVIIGGGFIGVELAEELSSFKDKNITVIEMLEYCLAANFDDEFSQAVEEKLRRKRINILTNSKVTRIGGEEKVEYVELNNGKKLPADQIIISVGAKPNIEMAESAGIKVDKKGGILTDEYMKTNIPNVFAVGDCAQTKDFITKKKIPIMLASVACYEARIAAINLYKPTVKNEGTVGAFSTYVNGIAFGAVGFIEKRVRREKKEIIIGEAETTNHHPGQLPGTQSIKVKLIFSKKEKVLIGAEIMGSVSIGEMINIVSLAIQQKMGIDSLSNIQFATHPLLTAAPTCYPLITAVWQAKGKIR